MYPENLLQLLLQVSLGLLLSILTSLSLFKGSFSMKDSLLLSFQSAADCKFFNHRFV